MEEVEKEQNMKIKNCDEEKIQKKRAKDTKKKKKEQLLGRNTYETLE